jgi:hypothetical protein
MIGRKPFENGSTRAASAKGRFWRRQWLARALGALACASERHIVGVQEPAYGKCR